MNLIVQNKVKGNSLQKFEYIRPSHNPSEHIYKCEPAVECVYCTEPKATCRQCKNQPNAYNMFTDLEGILSACLHLNLIFYPGVVNFCRYVFSQL
jgi:hypothetical protein